ncbi:hypothetical protein THIOM_005154 [Candidatus Thiomargarita nelsonii]|uniref:Uncharacterized protein n=1 Tax=Candidatus Thiomargarita nelsonii TaxID=1003181 RepID=A0A176RU05_9GAMM|nr:hypothetical protein THIOM_005154 [Candidatus Thiomargarita nelsonii]
MCLSYLSFISTVMMDCPALEIDVTFFSCGICWTAVSITSVTSSSTSVGSAPG